MDKFQNYYRIESARLKGWNYGHNASYFVTLCAGGRRCFFGEVVNKKINLCDAGKIADWLWREIPAQFNYACLDEYIVMPNHIHGIIQIDKPDAKSDAHTKKCNPRKNNIGEGGDRDNDTDDATLIGREAMMGSRDAINRVSTVDGTANVPNPNDPNTKNFGGVTGNFNPMLQDNLSRILRWYKGRATFEIRKVTNEFFWQARFHDRIIRDNEGLINARKYIIHNPLNWENDEYNSS